MSAEIELKLTPEEISIVLLALGGVESELPEYISAIKKLESAAGATEALAE